MIRGLGGGDVLFALRRLRIEPRGRDILAHDGDERQPKALVEVGHKLIPRHVLCGLRVFHTTHAARAKRQMPAHVVRVPPAILQSLPEEPRLANAANLVPARDNALHAVLDNHLTQRGNTARLQLLEPLVIRPQVAGRAILAQRGTLARRSGLSVKGHWALFGRNCPRRRLRKAFGANRRCCCHLDSLQRGWDLT